MEQVTLRGETGRVPGSRTSRRLRRAGSVPAVVYGRGLEPRSVAVDRRDLYAALHTEAGLNALINLQVDGEELLTVAREVQRHPVRGEITHLDFIRISLDESIEAEVPVEFAGIPVGVREAKGIVETVHASVIVSCLPTAIPSQVTLDISALRVGDSARVADLPALPGVAYVTDPDQTLLVVALPAAAHVEAAAVAAEAEGVEAAAEAEGEG
ncbi:MAG: 50S ribosomal protein L25 [Actinobacteria bacterium]|nr:50S ribosomal protein L25 [Actinomycetota bacterium]